MWYNTPVATAIGRKSGRKPKRNRGIAQLVEYRSPKPWVAGSNPPAPANTKGTPIGVPFVLAGAGGATKSCARQSCAARNSLRFCRRRNAGITTIPASKMFALRSNAGFESSCFTDRGGGNRTGRFGAPCVPSDPPFVFSSVGENNGYTALFNPLGTFSALFILSRFRIPVGFSFCTLLYSRDTRRCSRLQKSGLDGMWKFPEMQLSLRPPAHRQTGSDMLRFRCQQSKKSS